MTVVGDVLHELPFEKILGNFSDQTCLSREGRAGSRKDNRKCQGDAIVPESCSKALICVFPVLE